MIWGEKPQPGEKPQELWLVGLKWKRGASERSGEVVGGGCGGGGLAPWPVCRARRRDRSLGKLRLELSHELTHASVLSFPRMSSQHHPATLAPSPLLPTLHSRGERAPPQPHVVWVSRTRFPPPNKSPTTARLSRGQAQVLESRGSGSCPSVSGLQIRDHRSVCV